VTETPEQARNRHRPTVVKVLFIGESPPAGGTFFYFGDSKLAEETERAFRKVLPELIGDDFLSSFCRLGCYLDDLCLRPVNQLKKIGSAGREQLVREYIAGEQPLAERMAQADPAAIVLIGLGIEKNVRRVILTAGCDGLPFYPLPFPNWPDQVERYHGQLTVALSELHDAGVLGRAE
jgi:hypothetical protein